MNDRAVFGAPRVPDGMLRRAPLLGRIGRTPLTVLRGPGGSGKTVLMSQWISTSASNGVWVTVEPDIADRRAFWGAVADAASHVGVDVQLPSHDGGRGDEDGVRSALVRAFLERTEPFVLIIDDAHELHDSLLEKDLLEILRACPAVFAIVGTRSRGDLESPREALTLDIEVLGPDSLSLTVDEVGQLAGGGDSRLGSAAELLEGSGGNPLLLRAIVVGSSRARTGESAEAVVKDLLEGIFAREERQFRAFALATAVPNDLDETLAAHLSGLDGSRTGAAFVRLEEDGLLMRRETAEAPRFRYHPLVREVLREELRKSSPERYRRLSLLASATAEADGNSLAALRHAVDAEDYPRASDVCLHFGLSLLRSRGAAAILQRVPMRYVARLPFIAIVLALAANARGERWRALELMTLALGASRATRSRQRVAERIGLALVETVVLRITGRASESVAAARRMQALLDRASTEDLDDLEEIADQVDGFRLQGALSLFRAGLFSEARMAAERAGSSAHALSGGRPEALGAASVVAAAQALLGESVAAAETIGRIDESGYSIELLDGYVGSLAHLARGILAIELADPDAAEREADFVRERANLEHAMLFTALGALVWLWRGQPEVGLRLLDEREGVDRPRARVSKEDAKALAASRVLLHAALGRMGAAHETLRALDGGEPLGAVLEAHLMLLEQRPELVVERLDRVSGNPGPRLAAAVDILRACAAMLTENVGVAEAAMRRFLAAGAVDGILTPFVLIPDAHRAAILAIADGLGADASVLQRLRAVPAPFATSAARVLLTRREVDVLVELRTAASHNQIAASLGVSTNTVKSQVRTLYRKLGATQRDEALRAAYLQGLLESPVSNEPGRDRMTP